MINRSSRRTFLAITLTLLLTPSVYGKNSSRNGGNKKGSKSVVANLSRTNGGHMHKHVAKSRDHLHSRTQSMKAVRVFNAATHGIIKDGNGKGVKYHRPNAKALGHLQKALGSNVKANKAVKARLKGLKRVTAKQLRAISFHNAKTLDRVYNKNTRSQRKQLARWLSDPKGKPTFKLPFKEKTPIGHLYVKNPGQRKGRYSATNAGHFTMKRTADGKSFYPMTSMLY